MTTMTERPILMTTDNAQKCHDGRKTQTRRIVKPQPIDISWFEHQQGWCARVREDMGTAKDPAYIMVPCPYGVVGDRLWVREAWAGADDPAHKQLVLFRGRGDRATRWRSSIYMPRWACRTVLEITGVRVERVNDITEEDCLAEGIVISEFVTRKEAQPLIKPTFVELWGSINGPGSWDANPFVWVIEFKRVNP